MEDYFCLPFVGTGIQSKLIVDYLSGFEEVTELVPFSGDFHGIGDALEEREHTHVNREALAHVLREQYAKVADAHPAALNHIEALAQDQTYTVTTGHQLVLFGGPLYFVYKILHVVALTQRLRLRYPDKQFVPLFWMASEDHDLPEVDHLYVGPTKVQWHAQQSGPVGRMDLRNMEQVRSELANLLGSGERARHLLNLFDRAYLAHNHLAAATRQLVNDLFGHLGVVALDADHPALKSLFVPVMERELREEVVVKAMESTRVFLEENYFVQVNPRPINLFWMDETGRHRIERTETGFKAGHRSFYEDELLDLLHRQPDSFSPNVTLRPLYQETILPNLAYVGGGGELAYWLQLHSTFQAFGVFYPALLLRHSAVMTSAAAQQKLERSGLMWFQLFKPLHEIERSVVQSKSTLDLELTEHLATLELMFVQLEDLAAQTDGSMKGAVAAQRAKQIKGLENLKQKLLRAEKRRLADELARIEALKAVLFPHGVFQERRDHFSTHYLERGEELFQQLIYAFGEHHPSIHIF
jgi:bacillithiol biosynthesis cysteine-adding enzyme BshC